MLATMSGEFTLEWPTDALTESRVSPDPTLLGFKRCARFSRSLASVPLTERPALEVTAKVADQVRTPPAVATIFIYPE